MLGRLARWLRGLGFDTVHIPDVDDHDLVALADWEGRILLTRDRHLVTYLKPRTPVLLTSSSPHEQLLEVAEACGHTDTQGCFVEVTTSGQYHGGEATPERHLPWPMRRSPGWNFHGGRHAQHEF